MKYKTIVLVALLAFAVSLAVVVGERLSSEAMAVVIGVVAGIAASIPTSLIVVWMALRLRPVDTQPVVARPVERQEPRIVVVPAPAAAPGYAATAEPRYYNPSLQGIAPLPPLLPHLARRRFTVIGGEAEEELA